MKHMLLIFTAILAFAIPATLSAKTLRRCGTRGPQLRCRPMPRCVCPTVYRPVCGANGVTYSNSCRASCSGVRVSYHGRCYSYYNHCGCSYMYRPVCGTNGRTYRNYCWARCSGTGLSYYGRCYRRPIYPRPIYQGCPSGCKYTSYGSCQCPIR